MMDKIPYIISALDYRHSSSGIRVLHWLCKMLNEAGYEAYTNAKVAMKGAPTIYGQHEKLVKLIIDGAIAVYPEITNKNYLWSKNPIGWTLNNCNGSVFKFEREGLIFSFNPRYGKGPYLFLYDFLEAYFKDDKHYKRKYNILWVGKGVSDERMTLIPNKKVITLDYPRSRRKIAKWFKKAKCFYTYDARTNLIAEAKLCGCPVMLFENGKFNTMDDVKLDECETLGMTNDYLGLYKAKQELPAYKEFHDMKLIEGRQSVQNFIKISQQWAIQRNEERKYV